MKRILLSLTMVLTSLSSQANEVYFSHERMENLACTIARSMKKSYPNKTLRDLRFGIMDVLRKDINPWVDAYPIPAGLSFPSYLERVTGMPGFPMDRSEYYIPNALILYKNPTLTLMHPTENYFSSFIHLARMRQLDYLNGKTKKFKLRNEPDLLKQIEAHLPVVANYAFPFRDSAGNLLIQKKAGAKKKDLFTVVIGNPDHQQFNRFLIESQRFNKFSSPLFLWLLEQKDYSVSPENLFNKALEIYGDPLVSLGVIPWIFSGDALTVNRGTSSVVSYKIEKMVEGDDVPGLQYHFWGYLTQGLVGNKIRTDALSFIYEELYQHDGQDRDTDVLALKFGDLIRAYFKNPDVCR